MNINEFHISTSDNIVRSIKFQDSCIYNQCQIVNPKQQEIFSLIFNWLLLHHGISFTLCKDFEIKLGGQY